MKRILAAISLTFLGLATPASAIVGGPFDNGSHSASLEGGGYYRAILTFGNGSGYMSFSPEARIALIQTTDVSTRASMINRSVLYYKGITYVGAAFGSVDEESSEVQGELNAGSEVSNTAQQTQNNNNFFSITNITTTVSAAVVTSNRSYIANGYFKAKIRDRAPILKFVGSGELSFLSPTGADSVAGLAFTGYQGLINAINQFYSNVIAVGGGINILDFFLGGQQAIDNALNALPAHLTNAGIQATYNLAEVRKMRVRGTRRYFTSAPAVTAN
jgi:hypothetical protein